jgi:hypothetical protein
MLLCVYVLSSYPIQVLPHGVCGCVGAWGVCVGGVGWGGGEMLRLVQSLCALHIYIYLYIYLYVIGGDMYTCTLIFSCHTMVKYNNLERDRG